MQQESNKIDHTATVAETRSIHEAANSPAANSTETSTLTESANANSNTNYDSKSNNTKEESRRIPTDAELLTTNQRRMFKATDYLLGGVLGFMLCRLAFHLLDSPEVLEEVVKAAEEDELIQAKVGSPLKTSMLWSGNVNETNASLVIPISGPKGTATIHARAFYDNHFKAWKLMLLQASFDDTEGAQKHTLVIPERFVVRPRYVSPEEALRIKKKHDDMIAKMAELHAKKPTKQQEEGVPQQA